MKMRYMSKFGRQLHSGLTLLLHGLYVNACEKQSLKLGYAEAAFKRETLKHHLGSVKLS